LLLYHENSFFPPIEMMIKITIYSSYQLILFILEKTWYSSPKEVSKHSWYNILNSFKESYLFGFSVLFFLDRIIALFLPEVGFISFLLVSLYAAVGVLTYTMIMYWNFFAS
jgi:hypothetical protein